MFKKILLVLAAVLFLSKLSFADLTTYELVGSVATVNHVKVVKDVKSSLANDFKIIGVTHPSNDKNLTVFALSNKAYFDAVNKSGKYAFFAVPLRVGVQTDKKETKVMFTNPIYVADAFKGKSALKKAASSAKALLEKDLSKVAGIKVSKSNFGYSTDEEEIGDWQMMGQSIYTIYQVGKKFPSMDAALKALDASLAKHTNGWSKVYTIKLPKAVVVGVSNPKFEKEAFEIGGFDHLCAFPIELVIYDDGKVKALPEMYRMSLYFMDAGMTAFSAHMSMPGEIDDSLKGLLK